MLPVRTMMLNMIGTTYFVMHSMMNSSSFVIVILLSISKKECIVLTLLEKEKALFCLNIETWESTPIKETIQCIEIEEWTLHLFFLAQPCIPHYLSLIINDERRSDAVIVRTAESGWGEVGELHVSLFSGDRLCLKWQFCRQSRQDKTAVAPSFKLPTYYTWEWHIHDITPPTYDITSTYDIIPIYDIMTKRSR